MKIFVTGTRGIPNIPGGVESHCQQLYPLIVSKGHDVLLCRRKPYVSDSLSNWNGVNFIDVYAPHSKTLETFVHTFIALLIAKKWGADVVHVHAVGPALLIPFARLLGLNVVFTNHGPDYNRQKWGRLARFVLKLGEKLGGIFANEVIVISDVIRDIVKNRCHRNSHLIFNGVGIPQICTDSSYLSGLGIAPGKYILGVARFVPEKGLHDLINAYQKLDTDYHLVIAGDSDHQDEYSTSLKSMAMDNKSVILTGYITGDKLNQIFSHARLFVLPSYHEGLPIALLEAMSYGLPVLVSDIPANKAVGLSQDSYFSTGDINDLAIKIDSSLKVTIRDADKEKIKDFVKQKYNWNMIANQTVTVYMKVLGSES